MDGRQCRHCHPIPPKIPVGSGGRSSVAPPPGLAKHVTQLVHWGQHQQRTAVIPPGVVIVDVRVKLVPHCVAYPSPPSLECYPFIPVSVVTIGDRLHRDTPPPHPCPTADCCFYPLSLPSLPLDPPPSTSRRGLHLNLCCRHGGLILPGRQLHHVDCYVALLQAHDDVNLLQPSSTLKPPLPPPFPMDWMCIPGSGSSSGGGAILLVVLVLQAAARPPSMLPSMVGCCVPTPLSTAPTPAAFVQRHTIIAVLAPVFVQSGQRQQRILRRRSARIVCSMRLMLTHACRVTHPTSIVVATGGVGCPPCLA